VAEEVYQDFFAGVQAGLVVEQSHQGQLYRLIRMYVDVPSCVQPFAKSGSNPILARELLQRLREIVLDLQRRQAPEGQPLE
jgi:2-oxoglutarate ferredoxin oxidoreductase subunit alpha